MLRSFANENKNDGEKIPIRTYVETLEKKT
jgi:hypothetical protein